MSIFADEWRACLREQYKHVIRTNDTITRESLTGIMYGVGFAESELAQLRVEATMRVEDLPDDFVPDLEILDNEIPQAAAPTNDPPQDFQPHPLECQCPSCMEIALTPHDEEGQPIELDEEERAALEEEDPDSPKQISLF